MRRRVGRVGGRFVPLGVVVMVALPVLTGWHYATQGWRDHHTGYPPVPSGYTAIVNTFGQPCNANAHAVWMSVRLADTGLYKTVWFHKKLGGMATEMLSGKGGSSTNLDNDVFGHIKNNHLTQYVKTDVGSYACRAMRSGSAWSTHAWGIAIDVSWLYEPNNQCYSTTNYNFASIFQSHGWTWGLAWCDPMHFQYATNY